MTWISHFPFPFEGDRYRYTTNIEPARTRRVTAAGHWGENIVDHGPNHVADLAERTRILAADPRRHAALPHMEPAGWDALETVLTEMHRSAPDLTTLVIDEDRVRFTDAVTGRGVDVRRGDPTVDPLLLAARHTTDDIVLLDTRGGESYADAGVVTFASGWSMNFDLGMRFVDIHRPVPRLIDEGVIDRAQALLVSLGVDNPVRRTNWSLGVDGRLDQSAETRDEWFPMRRALETAAPDEVGRRLCLRVEVQHLMRLAPSGAVMFLIRTHHARLDDLLEIPGWADRFAAVVADLPRDMADYKGLTSLRPAIERWHRRSRRVGVIA